MSETREVAGSAAAFAPGGGGAMMGVLSAMDKSMGAESMAAMGQSADALVASAKSGGFRVTKEAADPIIKVLNNYIDEISAMRTVMQSFDKMPPLGNHDYGRMVAQHMHAAANDDQSVRASLDKLEIVLQQSREALLRASNQYEEQEESSQDAFRNLGG